MAPRYGGRARFDPVFMMVELKDPSDVTRSETAGAFAGPGSIELARFRVAAGSVKDREWMAARGYGPLPVGWRVWFTGAARR
jgi:hypothetical protein